MSRPGTWIQGKKQVTKTFLTTLAVIGLLAAQSARAGPEEDRLLMLSYYEKHFPNVAVQEFANGLYAFDAAAREQWLELEDFPPYEIAVEEGEEFFNTPFANGNSYADCFAHEGQGVRQNYPYFDNDVDKVITLELAINQCREKNDEQPLPYGNGELAAISAYMAFTSRGNTINVLVPEDNPKALAAFEAGKQFFYSRRGQLNFACSSCHVQAVGLSLRADPISTTVGQATHFPAYRTQWGEIVTLQRRFAECNFQVRARPFAAQSEQYRNLEYFLTYMSNGFELNGPASRR